MNYTVEDLKHDFTVHPRALCPHVGKEGATLDEVYNSYSSKKLRAYNDCVRLCERYSGFNAGISSHNMFSFTFTFELEDPETGELMQAIITPKYRHLYYR